MARSFSQLDAKYRELATLEVRTENTAKTVERAGAIVKALGYITMALGVVGGLIVIGAATSTRGNSTDVGIVTALTLFVSGFIWGIPLVLVGGYAQMRSLAQQADRVRRDVADLEALDSTDRGEAPTPRRSATAPTPSSPSGPGRTSPTGAESVRILAQSEKDLLSKIPPQDTTPGWHPDPLDQANQRYWNGTQWTGRITN